MSDPEALPLIARIAVYCGSSSGTSPQYSAAATNVGREIAHRGLELVYGGGNVGLMGAVANAALAAGGRVRGVITRALLLAEVGHTGLTSMEVVESMHERKAVMAEMADGFLALPGGFGTWDELFEVITWTQLGIHAKPVVLLNVEGFWDGIVAQTARASSSGFVKPVHAELLRIADSPTEALDALLDPVPLPTPKWANRS